MSLRFKVHLWPEVKSWTAIKHHGEKTMNLLSETIEETTFLTFQVTEYFDTEAPFYQFIY